MNIVYIAPEIPGLSSTFVYNEIFVLTRNGENVLPYTIHKNIANPQTESLRKLKAETRRLYGQGLWSCVKGNLFCLLTYRTQYLKTFVRATGDALINLSRPQIMLGIFYRFFIAGSLAKDIHNRSVDHIHAHFVHFPGDIAMYAGGITSIPFSLTAHANDIFCNFWLLKQKTRRAAFIATISEYNKRYLAELGCDVSKVEIVRCGVSYPELPAESNTESTGNRIGFIGRLVEKKGLELLIRACAVLRDEKFPFVLEVVGGGPLEAKMKELTEQLGLGDSISFLGGLPNDQVMPWLASLDAFVLPCVEDSDGDVDGIPVALMEAMVLKVPVISTRLSGIPELVVDNDTGLLANPNDVEGLARRIQLLFTQEELRESCIENAFKHVTTEFDAAKNALRLLALFRRD